MLVLEIAERSILNYHVLNDVDVRHESCKIECGYWAG
jgi:hypothetical protein